MTDQTQTTTEPVAWRIRPKGALGDVMGFQIVTNRYVAQDYSEQPAFEVQPLYTTPQPLAIGLDREALERMVTFAEKLCMAADHYGVKHLDSDDMDDEAVELEAATLCMRHVIADAILALAAPVEGYVLVPVEPTEAMVDAVKSWPKNWPQYDKASALSLFPLRFQ